MSGTDRVITLAVFMKFEAPDGDVRMCDGGMLEYTAEQYTSFDSVYGSVIQIDEIQTTIEDFAESGKISFIPNPDATVADWWRTDLYESRVRLWMGEVDSDGYTVSTATQLTDLLVDGVERIQSEGGENILQLDLIGRPEKLFLVNEGNVCSERFHKRVFASEDGFNNCTDIVGYVAWGIDAPNRGTGGSSGGGGGLGLFGGGQEVLK